MSRITANRSTSHLTPRRTIVTAVAALTVLGAGLSGCAQKSTDAGNASTAGASSGASGSGGGGTIRVMLGADTNIQDLWEKTIKPGFEKANPGTTLAITLDLHEEHGAQNLAKLTAAVKGDKDSGMDLIDAGFVNQAAQAGVLMEATKESISGLAEVPSDLITAGSGGGIPYRGSSVLLAYNSTKVATPPKTLTELLAWIKANKGQFTYNSPKSGGSGGSFVTTVLDQNISEADQQKMRTSYAKDLESQWAKGWETLRSLNPYVYQGGVYPNGNTQSIQLLASGQISMAPVWSDQFISSQKSGQIPNTIKVTQIAEPSFTGGAAYLGIPKNATNKDGAIKLVNYLLSPEGQDAIATGVAGYPVIPLEKLPASTQATFKDAHPENLRAPYFSQVSSDMQMQWDQQVPGK